MNILFSAPQYSLPHHISSGIEYMLMRPHKTCTEDYLAISPPIGVRGQAGPG